MKKLDIAELKRLHGLGFALHWLKTKSKMPLLPGWTSGPRLSWEEFKKTYRPGLNVGVRLGAASKLEQGFLAVLDLDIKSKNPKHKEEALAKLFSLFPEAKKAPCVFSGRGNGSAHYYVSLAAPVSGGDRKAQSKDFVKVLIPSVPPSRHERETMDAMELVEGWRSRAAWEISLLSEGRQVVLPGSIHPDTGREYLWGPAKPTAVNIPRLKAIAAGVSGGTKPQAVEKKSYKLSDISATTLGLRDDQVAALVEGAGVKDRSASVFSLCMAMLKRGVSEEKILSVLTRKDYFLGQTGFDHAKTDSRQRAAYWIDKYCLRKAREKVNEDAFDFAPVEIGEDGKPKQKKNKFGEEEITPHTAIGLDLEWQKELDLQKGPQGSPPTVRATFKNLRLILENEVSPELIKRNLFTHDDIWSVDTPWGIDAGKKRSGNQDDALRLKSWLIGSVYHIEASLNMIDEVVSGVAVENAFHPVKDFLEALEWDGVSRVEKSFFTYLGARMPKVYQRAVARKFFQALVARIYEPGCKFDHMPVLEGKQGVGKSTFGRILVGDDWYMDGLPEFSDKDAALNLQGIWLCEISELAAVYRSANETAKAFITRQTDKIRPPYGHRRVDYPRSSVFIGTTNARDYLTDPTGNRRFWPVEIERCDFKALVRDRLQLLAEAKFLYDNLPEPLYLDNNAEAVAKRVQESRRVEDESDAMLSAFLKWRDARRKEKKDFDLEKLEIEELLDRGPFIGFQKTMANRKAAAGALRVAGFVRVHTEHGKRWVLEEGSK